VLGQIPGNQHNEFIKSIKIGDLSMRTKKIPIDDLDQTESFHVLDGPPIRRLATTWILTDLGLFWINLTIIGPVPEEAEGRFPLAKSQADNILETIADTIEFLKKKLR